jgi:hypothetical protein
VTKHKFVRLAMVTAIAVGAAGLGAVPSGAAAPAQSCSKVKGTLTMKPGLGPAAADQTVTIIGAESGCKVAAKTGGSGSFKSVLKLKKASCATLVKGGTSFSGAATTTWKNKKTTKYSVTYKDGKGSSVATITMTGTATSGLFSGKKFAGGFTITVPSNVNCTSVKFTKATFTQSKPWSIS